MNKKLADPWVSSADGIIHTDIFESQWMYGITFGKYDTVH
jgi:hypothetical protein